HDRARCRGERQGDYRPRLAAHRALRLRAGAKRAPSENRRHPQGEHHEALRRPLPRLRPSGGEAPPPRPLRGADRRQRLHAARPPPAGVRRAPAREPLRRHRLRPVRRPGGRARPRAGREPWRALRHLRSGARDRPRHHREEPGEPARGDPLERHAAAPRGPAPGGEALDVLVVGGGINGAGIARDAAMRGLRVALVERGDLASGTSSRSSKLIHGGLRYLEQGDVRLVLEAVRERERLQRLAPHLVRPQEFVFPLYRGGPLGPLKLAVGLWAYDLLAGFWNVRRHRMLSPKAVAEAEPALLRDGLCGAGQYWDCRTDDARLVLETALSAAAEGALIVSYAEVAGFVKEGGRIAGARVVDRLGGGEVIARARVVVNAAGPWVDRVAALDAPETPPRLRLTKGVHVVVPRERVGNRAAIVLSAVADRRVMFVIPWGAHTLVGTTDTDHLCGPDVPPAVEPSDVAYLLDTVNHYFPAARLVPADVVGAFAGLRPLVAPRGKATMSPSAVSREEE